MTRIRNHITLILLLLIAAARGICGDASLHFFNVDPSAWPAISAQFFAFDSLHQPLRDLVPSDFVITENDSAVSVTRVSCPAPVVVRRASVVFSLDLSGSMGEYVDENGTMSIELAQRSARTMLDALPVATTVIALQTCTDVAVIAHDFTSDFKALRSEIDTVQPVGGNDFVEQLLNPLTGALNIAKTGSGSRAVVVFTDAWWSAMPDAQVQRCKDTCAKYHIQVYAIVFTGTSASPNGIKSSLGAICAASGGVLYDGVVTSAQASTIAQGLENQLSGDGACTVEWMRGVDCNPVRAVRMALHMGSAPSNVGSYVAAQKYLSHAIVNHPLIDCGLVFPSPSRDTSFTITATNRPLTIQSLQCSDARFSLPGVVLPMQLPVDSIAVITLRFTPYDSTYAFASISIVSDACINDTLYCAGGLPGAKPITRSLHLLHPNGGEIFTVNDSIDFSWTGVPLTDGVRLEFSNDNGASWKTVSDSATGWHFRWKLPSVPSNVCLARVSRRTADDDSVVVMHAATALIEWQLPVTWILFSPDDSVILLPSDSLYLANGVTGAITHMLSGNGNGLIPYSQHGAFMPDSRTVLAGSPVSGWDTKSGKKLYTLADEATDVMVSSDGYVLLDKYVLYNNWPTAWPSRHMAIVDGTAGGFSPDGTDYFFAIGNGGNIEIQFWKSSTGGLLSNMPVNTSSVTSMQMNASHTQLLTTRGDSMVMVWDVPSGYYLMSMKLPGINVADAQYSPAGNYIFTPGPNGSEKLWDAKTAAYVRSFGGPGLRISKLKMRSDDKVFAAVVNDTAIGLWDVTRGLLLNYWANDTSITSIDMNRSGNRVAFGDAKGVTRLWKLDAKPVQQDTSDAVWRIAAPSLSATDVDFGSVLFSGSRDSVVQHFLTNVGGAPATITSMSIIGTNAADFFLASGATPATLAAGDSRALELRFAPLSTGIRIATLRIIAGDTVVAKLKGVGVLPAVEVNSGVVDFGMVSIDSVRDTTVTAVIRNVGATPLVFARSQQRGPDIVHFGIDSGDAPFTLAPKESRSIKMHFAPTAAGRFSGAIAFPFNGTGSPAIVPLFGTAVPHGPHVQAPTGLSCGTTTCAAPSTQASFDISNDGGSPLIISGETISGANAGSFHFSNPLPDTIPTGATSSYTIVFTPQRAGSDTATVILHMNAVNDSIVVLALTGIRDSTSFDAKTDSLTTGILCPGETWDTVIVVRNTGTTALNMHSAIGGTLHIDPADTVIAVSDSMTYRVHFDGASIDTAETFSIAETDCGINSAVFFQARVSAPSVAMNTISMIGPLGGFTDSEIVVSNPSSRMVTVDSITFDDPQFTLPTVILPFVLAPGGSQIIDIRYTPSGELPVTSTVTVWGSPCAVRGSNAIHAVPTVASSLIALSSEEAIPGVKVAFTMTLQAARDLDSVGAKHFVATIRLPGNLLIPADTGITVSTTGTLQTHVTFSGMRSDTTAVLRTLQCRTMIGDTDLALVVIESFAWTDGAALITTVNGTIHILNTCPLGGPMNIRYIGASSVSAIIPNPTSAEVNLQYHVITAGAVKLGVFDVLGRCVANVVDDVRGAGEYAVDWNASGLAPGVYACVLRTAEGVARRSLVISR